MDLFFLFKKLVSFIIMPLPLSLVFMLIAFFCFYTKPMVARGSLLIATCILFISGSALGSKALISPLEQKYPVFQQQDTAIKFIVILGCGHTSDPRLVVSQQLKICSLQRSVEGLRIANLHPNATIITSGAAFGDSKSNATAVKEALISYGVNPRRIISFNQPMDTEAEAKVIAPLIAGEPSVLVTNANHMSRALFYFEQQNSTPIPAPTGFTVKQGKQAESWMLHIPRSGYMTTTELAIYEYLGQLWQWIKS
ncbi:ElyC/SanA/YdcF family protein [Thalassotalea aquiviva]|uniref:ElyC/SanA/YdcF family protein n=1 Tax=Thalassotalea aquiviva TaxID=3242415 RepID=UPI00352A96DA